MNTRSLARILTAITASTALLIASTGPAWAQHGGGGSHGGGGAFHGGGGFHGGAVPGGAVHGGFHGGFRGGYHGGYYGGWHGGWHGGYGWGWRPGWGWWWGGWGVPLGAYLSVLPWSYSTIWWGGVPYYYANNGYYVWNGSADQYQQVQPPPEVMQEGAGAPSASQELYAYPMHGQASEQQARDKQECREWASGQMSGGSQPPNGPPGASAPGPTPDASGPPAGPPPNTAASGGDYLRAEAACLEARGYSVK